MIQAALPDIHFASTPARDEVTAYCAAQRIAGEFRVAVELACEVFRQVKQVSARLQVDPETDESRVVIDVAVGGNADEVLRQKKEFTDRWIQVAPPEIRERIRVLYHFA